MSSYRALDSAMPNEILDEDNLNEQIRIRRIWSPACITSPSPRYQQGGDNLVSQTNLLHHLTSHMLVLRKRFANSRRKSEIWVSLARVPVVCLRLVRTTSSPLCARSQYPQTRDRSSADRSLSLKRRGQPVGPAVQVP